MTEDEKTIQRLYIFIENMRDRISDAMKQHESYLTFLDETRAMLTSEIVLHDEVLSRLDQKWSDDFHKSRKAKKND